MPGRYALRHEPGMLTVPTLEDACLIVGEVSRGRGGSDIHVMRELDGMTLALHRQRDATPAEGLVVSARLMREAEDLLAAAKRLDAAVRLWHQEEDAGRLPSGELVIILQMHLESLHTRDHLLAS